MAVSELALLERWRRERQADAIAELVARHSGMVYGTCRRILGDAAQAEEVAQECFIELLKSRTRIASSVGGWLHRLAVSRSLDRRRAESRRVKREERYAEARTTQPAIELNETVEAIDEAISELPDDLRSVVVLRYLESEKHQDIAVRLGVSESTVRYRLNKGIERLRAILERKGVVAGVGALTATLQGLDAAACPNALIQKINKLAAAGVGGSHASTPAHDSLGLKIGAAAVAALVLIVSGVLFVRRSIPPVEETASSVQVAAIEPAPAARRDAIQTPEDIESAPPQNEESSIGETAQPAPLQIAVSGYVVDDRGYGVSNARVSVIVNAARYEPRGQYDAYTDANGLYEIDSIAVDGAAEVAANAEGFKSASKQVTLEEDGQAEANFILNRGTNLLGRVISAENKPADGVLVSVIGIDLATEDETHTRHGTGGYGWSKTFTDEKGVFFLGLDYPGTAAIYVDSNRHGRGFFNDVPVGSSEPVTLQLEPNPVVHGTVRRFDGSPVPNVKVNVVGRYEMAERPTSKRGNPVAGQVSSRKATTDVDGRYELVGLMTNLDYSLQVETADYGALSEWKPVGYLSPSESVRVDITLDNPIRVFGSVVGKQTGLPIRHMRVVFEHEGAIDVGVYLRNQPYEFRVFEPGTYAIWPEYDGVAREQSRTRYEKTITVQHGDEVELDFAVEDPFTLSVRVVDASGDPIAGANVLRTKLWPTGGTTTFGWDPTDADGRYAYEYFEPHLESWFKVEHPGYVLTETEHIVGEPGVVYPEQTVVLHEAAGVEGVFLRVPGVPLNDYRGQVQIEATGHVLTVETGPEGEFTLVNTVPAVRSRLAFKFGDQWSATLGPVELEAGAIVDLGTNQLDQLP